MNAQADLLRGLSLDEAEQTLALGVRHTLSNGQQLFELGSPADSLYLIQRGRIRLTLHTRRSAIKSL